MRSMLIGLTIALMLWANQTNAAEAQKEKVKEITIVLYENAPKAKTGKLEIATLHMLEENKFQESVQSSVKEHLEAVRESLDVLPFDCNSPETTVNFNINLAMIPMLTINSTTACR